MKVARLDEKAILPTVKHRGDAGMDFYSLEDYIIKPHTYQICRTGITVKIPLTVVGLIWPKSGSQWLIGGGVIDNTYQGEILFKIFNTHDADLVIRYGDALGQMIFVYNLEPTVEEVVLDKIHKEIRTARGASGGIVKELVQEPMSTGQKDVAYKLIYTPNKEYGGINTNEIRNY